MGYRGILRFPLPTARPKVKQIFWVATKETPGIFDNLETMLCLCFDVIPEFFKIGIFISQLCKQANPWLLEWCYLWQHPKGCLWKETGEEEQHNQANSFCLWVKIIIWLLSYQCNALHVCWKKDHFGLTNDAVQVFATEVSTIFTNPKVACLLAPWNLCMPNRVGEADTQGDQFWSLLFGAEKRVHF